VRGLRGEKSNLAVGGGCVIVLDLLGGEAGAATNRRLRIGETVGDRSPGSAGPIACSTACGAMITCPVPTLVCTTGNGSPVSTGETVVETISGLATSWMSGNRRTSPASLATTTWLAPVVTWTPSLWSENDTCR